MSDNLKTFIFKVGVASLFLALVGMTMHYWQVTLVLAVALVLVYLLV